ncbi:MAG: hypothetical protein HC906_07910 [Bacteroidales bacterium]|nr:hypothetical protein [Bacteroidales bacterium]
MNKLTDIPKTENQIPLKEPNNSPEQKAPCTLFAEYKSEPSCDNQPTGTIIIHESSITGGTPPYRVYLNGFEDQKLEYRNLYPGKYSLKIMDSGNCFKEWTLVEVKKKECLNDYRFAPLYGEVWEIPLDEGKQGILTIFSRNGYPVYRLSFSGNFSEVWNGRSHDDNELQGGVYPFEIIYEDGITSRGTVTIVR